MLHELENNETILLMYLAGELPADDMQEVQSQLAADAGLRAALEQLRQTHEALSQTIAGIDGEVPSSREAAARESAVRHFSRAMVRHQLEAREKQAPAARAARRRFRLPSWTYPFAAAAMLIIAYVAWWGFSNNTGGPKIAILPDDPIVDDTSRNGVQGEMIRRGLAPLPSLGVDDGDRNLLAISNDSYDVSAMFQAEED